VRGHLVVTHHHDGIIGGMIRAALVCIGLLGMAAFFVGMAAGVPWLRLAAKPLPVLTLVPLVWSARQRARPGVVPLTAVGLLFGAAGDVILERGHFVPGLVAFLLGHLAYVAAMTRDAPRLAAPLLLPVAAYTAALLALVWDGLGPMRLPVAVYGVVITAMLWRAAARAAARADRAATVGLVGAIVFAFSDSLIAVNRFYAPFTGASIAIMVTYWLAQVLIAASIAYAPEA